MRPLLFDSWPSWDTLTQDGQVRPVFFVYLDFGTPVFDEITYQYPYSSWDDNGYVQNITFPRENLSRDRQTFSISIGGFNTTLLTYAQAARQDLNWTASGYDLVYATVDMWFLNSNQTVHSEASYPICGGLLDSCEIVESPDGSLITWSFAQSTDWQLDKPVVGRYTDAFQKSLVSVNESPTGQTFSGDRGFEFVESLQDWQQFWAKPKPAKGGKRGNRRDNRRRTK